MSDKKPITRLPTQWPLKGNIRSDYKGLIVLMHMDRSPMVSADGKTWRDVDLTNREDNNMMFHIERERITRR